MNDIHKGEFSLDDLLKEVKSYMPEEDAAAGDYNLDSLLKEFGEESQAADIFDTSEYDNEDNSAYEKTEAESEPEAPDFNLSEAAAVDEIDVSEEETEEIHIEEDTQKFTDEIKEKTSEKVPQETEENVVSGEAEDERTEFERRAEEKIESFIRRVCEAQDETEAIEEEQRQFRREAKKAEQYNKSGKIKFSFKNRNSGNIFSSVSDCTKACGDIKSNDAKEIDARLAKDVDSLRICTAMTAAFSVLLFLAGAVPQFLSSFVNAETALAMFGGSAQFYLIANLVLLTAACAFGYKVIFNGIKALFKGSVSADTGVALALILSLVQNILFIFTDELAEENIRLMGSVAVFGLFLLMAARMIHLQQAQERFDFCAEDKPLYNASRIKDSADIGAIGEENSSLRYSAKVMSLAEFFETSARPLPCDKTMRRVLPAALLASVAVGLITWLISGERLTGFTALTAMVSVSVPAAVTLTDVFSFALANNSLKSVKAAIHSCEAAEKCAETDGVIFDADEIFKNGGNISPNFKTFKNSRIDEAILNAAALTIAVDGPLADSFKAMLISDKNMLPTVREARFEDGLGIAGRVNGQFTLLGSRSLMEKYEVPLSSPKEESAYKRDGSSMLYLAENGRLLAVFAVTYQANRSVGACMRRLAKDGVVMYIRSDDPGITEKFVEEVFHLPQNSVKIIRGFASSLFRDKYEMQPLESDELSVMHRGRLSSFLNGIDACFRLKRTFETARTVEHIGLGVGIALFSLLCFIAPDFAGASQIFAYQLLFAGINLIVPMNYKGKKR